MLSYRNGDEDAFEMLYRRHEKPLLNFLYRVVMNAADAENLCHETFFRVVRAKKKYEATAQFKTWLFQIALNLCRDRVRRMKHRSHLSLNARVASQNSGCVEYQEFIPDPSPDIVKYVESEELVSLIKGAIKVTELASDDDDWKDWIYPSPDGKWISYDAEGYVKTRPAGTIWEVSVKDLLSGGKKE